MALAPGTRIGPYEVVSFIGAGGMGEVYRARDSKLDRQVALKILPDTFANDTDRLMRFDREARTLASLNHPHIAQIYGIEERALAMEFVEGATLADLIAAGPLPMDDALEIARQMTEALEAAHQQGIVHRDLKPANVKVRGDGTVKVLDFGLAKALDPGDGRDSNLANSPTITSPAMTMHGVIMGTAPYMAPEQARGRAIDRRADVWAFGVVLYEMLTRRRAFEGEDTTAILARVIERDPDWSLLPANTPPSVHRLLRRCLQKNPSHRMRDLGDARLDIADALVEGRGTSTAPAASGESKRSRWLPWMLAAGVAGAAFMVGRWLERPAPLAAAVNRLTVNLPDETELASFGRPVAVLSPDGQALAIVGDKAGERQILLRRLDTYDAKPIAGTEGGDQPFFSPDGRWLGFRANGIIKKVELGGGVPLEIGPSDGLGAAWLTDETIVFNREYQDGLYRVPASGGKATRLTEPDRSRKELGHFWPQVMPDGRHILFTSYSTPIDQSRIEMYALDTGQRSVVIEGGMHGQYVGDGNLVYVRADSMVAVPFDAASLRVMGAPVPLSEDAVIDPSNGVAHLNVASNGTMAYIPSSMAQRPRSLVWVDRTGNMREVTPVRKRYADPRLSPDGNRVAVTITDRSRDVWIEDLARRVSSRVTSGPASEFAPIWMHNGSQLLFTSETPVYQIFGTPLPAGTAPRPIVATEYDTVATSITPDDVMVLYYVSNPKSGEDIMMARLDGKDSPKVILNSRFDEVDPALSPDGHWLAYSSDESGRSEVYVQAFPNAGERWRVSTDRGFAPRWSRDGRELFFVSGSRMYAVPIKTSPTFSPGTPVVLFEQRPDRVVLYSGYDVAKDGRFVMVQHDPGEAHTPINIVTHWVAELKAKVK
jgi:Tol biopolymer transport system component